MQKNRRIEVKTNRKKTKSIRIQIVLVLILVERTFYTHKICEFFKNHTQLKVRLFVFVRFHIRYQYFVRILSNLVASLVRTVQVRRD